MLFLFSPIKMKCFWGLFFLVLNLNLNLGCAQIDDGEDNPLSKINILKTTVDLQSEATVTADWTSSRGPEREGIKWAKVEVVNENPTEDDWIGVFSPATFDPLTCGPPPRKRDIPITCTAPVKYKLVKKFDNGYTDTGKTLLYFRLINQRADVAFALFSGGISEPTFLSKSNKLVFENPKAPLYPRLALGKSWDEMTVTWTSGYDTNEAVPFVKWWWVDGKNARKSPAGTLTFKQNSMCGDPASGVGWHDPGFIHTSFLKNLWPNTEYKYKVGHRLLDGSNKIVLSETEYQFKSPPYPGQNSKQSVIIFGDMGKAERDESNSTSYKQPGALWTTDKLIEDIDNIDIVFHIGDLSYADGYISEWDQFIAQVEPIASKVPYMVASGNHERDWPNSGSFYDTKDSRGECGVPAETLFYYPAENTAKFWYSADYGLFHFCIADSEHDWREGSEQYRFIEKCLASADRHKQPWLIFAAHRVLGYSSGDWSINAVGSFQEPMGRDDLQKLWQKYKVDIAFYGHVHQYERTCPIYQNKCVNEEKHIYSGVVNGTIHVVVGGAGRRFSDLGSIQPSWSLYREKEFGFVKLTALDQSNLEFEYKRSKDGEVSDYFKIKRNYKDVLACVHDGCEPTTWAI